MVFKRRAGQIFLPVLLLTIHLHASEMPTAPDSTNASSSRTSLSSRASEQSDGLLVEVELNGNRTPEPIDLRGPYARNTLTTQPIVQRNDVPTASVNTPLIHPEEQHCWYVRCSQSCLTFIRAHPVAFTLVGLACAGGLTYWLVGQRKFLPIKRARL